MLACSAENNSAAVPPKNSEVLPAVGADELEELKEVGVKTSSRSELSTKKLAAVLSAYLVDYDNGKRFREMKK